MHVTFLQGLSHFMLQYKNDFCFCLLWAKRGGDSGPGSQWYHYTELCRLPVWGLGRCKQEITIPKKVLSLGPRISGIKKAMAAEQQSRHPGRSVLALKRWDKMKPERHWYRERPTCATLASIRQLK